MPDRTPDENQDGDETPRAIAERVPGDELLGEEEKILAGRVDVNLPALLTKDVQGG